MPLFLASLTSSPFFSFTFLCPSNYAGDRDFDGRHDWAQIYAEFRERIWVGR